MTKFSGSSTMEPAIESSSKNLRGSKSGWSAQEQHSTHQSSFDESKARDTCTASRTARGYAQVPTVSSSAIVFLPESFMNALIPASRMMLGRSGQRDQGRKRPSYTEGPGAAVHERPHELARVSELSVDWCGLGSGDSSVSARCLGFVHLARRAPPVPRILYLPRARLRYS